MDHSANSMGRSGEFVPGALLDGVYRVEALIGRGAMGSVWRAHDLGRDAPVAIKVLARDLDEDRDLARFEREARLAAQVDRDGGVVRVDAFGVVAGRPYCVMELVEGRDLEQVFERESFSFEQLAEWLEQVARTLAHCHRQGVVHRDLKPANIMMPTVGRPKLTDFGLARSLGRSDRLTRTGELSGTPSYMAPEQVADSARAVDPRVDVYALGAILYRGLAGRPPFTGALLNVLNQVLTREPDPPSAMAPKVPEQLEAIALKALAKSPDDRYADATALAEDLRRFRAGESSEAQRAERSGRRREFTLAAIGSVLLGVLLAGGAFVFAKRSPEQVLAEFERWDGQDCEHPSGTCPPEEHVLASFALGLGPGKAPSLDELGARRRRLQAASTRAEGELRQQLDAAGDRVEAHMRLLGDGPPGAGGNEATQRLVAALQALKANSLADAQTTLLRRPTTDWPRAGGRVWVRVWGGPDTSSDWRPLRRALTDRLPRLPALDPQRSDLVAAASAVAGRWLAGRLIQALDNREPRQLADEVSAFGEALCATWPPSARRTVWSAARERGLVLAGERLRAELERANALSEERRFVALGHALRCAGALITPAPRVEGADLTALLAEPLEALSSWRESDADEALERTGALALAYDVAAFDAWGWSAPVSAGYRRFLYSAIRDVGASALDRELLLLTVMRHDIRDAQGELVSEGVGGCFQHLQGGELLKRRPKSRALRIAKTFAELLFGDDGTDREGMARSILELTEQATEPGLIEDVAPSYLADLHEECAEVLQQWGENLRGRKQREVADKVALHAREAIRLADTTGELEDAYRRLADALEWQHAKRETLNELLGEGVTRLRRRLADAERDDPTNLELRGRQLEGLVKLLITYASKGKHTDKQKERLLREAAELAIGAQTWRVAERYDTVGRLVSYLRDRGRLEAAEQVVQEHSPAGYASEWFLREATHVAIDLKRPEDLKLRFRTYVEAAGPKERRKRYLRQLVKAIKAKGLEVPD